MQVLPNRRERGTKEVDSPYVAFVVASVSTSVSFVAAYLEYLWRTSTLSAWSQPGAEFAPSYLGQICYFGICFARLGMICVNTRKWLIPTIIGFVFVVVCSLTPEGTTRDSPPKGYRLVVGLQHEMLAVAGLLNAILIIAWICAAKKGRCGKELGA